MFLLLACLPELTVRPESGECGDVEICNDIDDDCDGKVDESPVDGLDWSLDADGDGYGDPATTQNVCTAPPNRVPDATDCDDTDPDAHPGAEESCNGADDDCDGVTDEDGVDASPWYVDEDGDEYGVGDATYACDAPDGMTALLGDCDDTEPGVYPDADEYCNGVDDDCDGAIDDHAVDAPTWYQDDDGDGYGASDSPITACDKPDAASESDGDCDDDAFGTNPGAADGCNGLDDDCSGVVDDGSTCPCDMEWSSDDDPYMFCGAYSLEWTTARDACAYYGYHLITIDDSTEDSWVENMLIAYNLAGWWTGYNDRDDEGVWAWEDGSSSTYTRWADDEPNNWWGEDCMELWDDKYSLWNDEDCDEVQHFICELN
ncbi:MAG: hypothetical protein GY913_31865 [Proteobacteria bacterium]|nr:hypothetical protein [Pseudomonadota bacterium]